ncbi:MAG: NAD-dependent epimerase/dehydratase family protein [Rhodobacteraceae bacterium]|nr:NAD-dependent epimerase/dehydratase family protein [Paracoccaceae bacterium]
MSQTVLLTGASGFIAKHIVLRLLERGHRVRGSLRSAARAGEVRAAVAPHLTDPAALDRLSFVVLDLDGDEGWAEAAAGADAVIHTASPFPIRQPADADVLIRPAVQGTLRALRAARAAGIGRVILTSSTAAMVNAPLPAGRTMLTEADWSPADDPAGTPYVRSKTLAERAAWDLAAREAPGMALTVINPAFVLGPPLDDRFGSSVGVVARMLGGRDPAVPRLGFAVVDVRDVAEMHLRALERPETAGLRFLAAAGSMWFRDMALVLKAAFPDRRIATREAPDWLIRLLARFDGEIRAILPALGRIERFDATRAEAGMGMAFVPPAEALLAAARHLVARGLA